MQDKLPVIFIDDEKHIRIANGQTLAKTDINPIDGGIIKLGGELWLSRPADEVIIKQGSKVRVIRSEGVSLIVEGVTEQENV